MTRKPNFLDGLLSQKRIEKLLAMASEDAPAPVADLVEERIQRAISRYVACGIGLEDAELIAREKLIDTLALERTRQWLSLATRGAVLVLLGPCDQSKTIALSWAVAMGPPLGPPTHTRQKRWPNAQAPRLLRSSEYRRLVLGRGHSQRTGFDELMDRTVVAVDDVGTEFAMDKSSSASAIHELVDVRQKRGYWTLLASNLRQQQFRKLVDQRLLSRLESRGSGLIDLYSKPQRKFRGA